MDDFEPLRFSAHEPIGQLQEPDESDFEAHREGPFAGKVTHGCEGAYGITWNAEQARAAAKKLWAMAYVLDGKRPPG
jgi:hypothetical protein